MESGRSDEERAGLLDGRSVAALERFFHFDREFARMIHVDAHPERMMFGQNRAQLGRNPLREENRNARSNSKKLDVFDRAQPRQQLVDLIVGKNQRIAAAQKNVANFSVLFEITKRFLEICV